MMVEIPTLAEMALALATCVCRGDQKVSCLLPPPV